MKKVFSSEGKTDIEKRTLEEQEKLSGVSTAVELAKADLELLAKAKSALEVGVMNASQLETEAKRAYLEIKGDTEIALQELDIARRRVAEVESDIKTHETALGLICGDIEDSKGRRTKIDLEIDTLTVKRGALSTQLNALNDEIALATVAEKTAKEAMLERNKDITARNEELSVLDREILAKNDRLGQLHKQIVEFQRMEESAKAKKNAELDAMDKAILDNGEVQSKLAHEKAKLEHTIEKRDRAEREMREFMASKERLIAVIAEQTDYLQKLKQDKGIKEELGL